MASVGKHHYVIELDSPEGPDPWLDFEVELRAPGPADLEDLARLMLDAYRGTVDYDGESLEEAMSEIGDYLDDDPRLDCSFVATVDGRPAGAILASRWRGQPLVNYVMTRPKYKNQGLGTLLLRSSLRALRDQGERRVHAFITEGNIASEALFRGAGARLAPD